MRLMGAGLTAAAFLAMGILWTAGKRRRLEALREMCSGLEYIHAELSTRLTALPEMILRLSERLMGQAGEFFSCLFRELERLGEEEFFAIWCRCADNCLSSLRAGEIGEIKNLGVLLGSAAVSEQCGALNSCLGFLRAELQDARQQYPAERKLGLGLGAAAAALVVLGLI